MVFGKSCEKINFTIKYFRFTPLNSILAYNYKLIPPTSKDKKSH